MLGGAINKGQDARIKLRVVLATYGAADYEAQDFSTKEKAQAVIGLPFDQLVDEKIVFFPGGHAWAGPEYLADGITTLNGWVWGPAMLALILYSGLHFKGASSANDVSWIDDRAGIRFGRQGIVFHFEVPDQGLFFTGKFRHFKIEFPALLIELLGKI